MKIALAGDHAGFEYKKVLIEFLESQGHEITNYGTNSEDSCDYPDYIHPAAQSIINNENELGIFICGSANGVCMTANKYAEIRAAICWNTELAELARQHNNANAICIPARFVDLDLAKEMSQVFINTEFEGGRHQRRVNKIAISE